MSSKSILTRAQARALLIGSEIRKLSPEERQTDLEDYWNGEYFSNLEDLTEAESAGITEKLIEEMLADPTPADWISRNYEPVLQFVYRNLGLGYTNQYLLKLLREHGYEYSEIDGVPEAMDPCYCCYYLVFLPGDSFGSICPVCFWQDAPGANRTSLAEARVNFETYGACTAGCREYVLKESGVYLKGPGREDLETMGPMHSDDSDRGRAHKIVNQWFSSPN